MNWFDSFLSSTTADVLGWVLVHSLWQIMLVGLLLTLVLQSISGSRSRIRYGFSLVALALVVLVPAVTGWVLVNGAINAPGTAISSEQLANNGAVRAATGPAATRELWRFPYLSPNGQEQPYGHADVDGQVSSIGSAPALDTNEQGITRSKWPGWMAAIWLAGILVGSLRPIIGLAASRQLRIQGRTPVDDSIEQAVQRLAKLLGIPRIVQVSQSCLVQVPTLIGVWRPVILLPLATITQLTPQELEAILLHELAHVRRCDQWINLLQTLIETLFFYHPAAWWISGVVRQERENCCDDLAIKYVNDKGVLARALLTLESWRSASAGTMALQASGGQLLQRIRRLAEPAHQTGTRLSRTAAVAIAALLPVLIAMLISMVSRSLTGTAAAGPDSLSGVVVTSVSDLYDWETVSTRNPRLMHRFWNLFTPELREKTGEARADWKPDLEFEFQMEGEESATVHIQVGLQDGFCWSCGKGVWPLEGQWPMRYSMAELIRDARAESGEQIVSEDESTIVLRERMFNNSAYHQLKASLAERHHGKWVAIVDGRVLASFDSFEDCRQAADQANRFACHRFIFRPGVDDQPEEFAHSPWITGSPNWWQLGIRFRQDNRIGTATDRWFVGEQTCPTGSTGKAIIGLQMPGNENESVSRAALCSGMVTQQLTMVAEDVNRLQLNRFAVPGTARSLTYNVDCHRYHVVVAIPELGIEQTVIGFAMPEEVVMLDPPGVNADPNGFQFFVPDQQP